VPTAGTLTGTLSFREPAVLTAEAEALVVLVEGAGKPTAGSFIASDKIVDTGQVPIAFEIDISRSSIDPSLTYSVVAVIVDGDRVWATPHGTPVVTKGNPTSGVALELSYRADLLKGHVTGAVSGVGIELGPEAYSVAVLLDVDNDETVSVDVDLSPVAVPVAFAIPFDPATINQSVDYVVTASLIDGESRWENSTGVPVITNGNPLAGITVPVTDLAAPTDEDDGLGLIGRIVGVLGLVALIVAAILFIRSRRPPTPEPAVAAATDEVPRGDVMDAGQATGQAESTAAGAESTAAGAAPPGQETEPPPEPPRRPPEP
jgi:uncharacterized lipoprotein YbaY